MMHYHLKLGAALPVMMVARIGDQEDAAAAANEKALSVDTDEDRDMRDAPPAKSIGKIPFDH